MEETMARSIIGAFGALAALSLVGCSTGKDTGGNGTTGGTTGPAGCEVTISETVPAADTTDFYYQSNIEVMLSEADSTATVTLSDDAGNDIAGTASTSEDGTVIYFDPTDNLAPLTGYTISISTCGGEQNSSVAFSTSELGTPIECDLSGKAYRVDLASARFVQPDPAVASLLFDALEDDILLGVSSQGDASLTMLGALSDGAGGQQNYCLPSIEFPTEAVFDDPAFSVGPADTTIDVAGVSVTISNFGISGAFAPDCTYFGGGKLTGELDARVLGPLVGELLGEEDPDAICSLLTTFGVTCNPCSSDGEPYCAAVEVDQIAASTTGVALSCVSGEECHPACATSTCDDPTAGICD
jgi:hypothetical protein